jgi:type II secretory pathway pseudopilin PulG
MIAVTVIGILAALARPAFQRVLLQVRGNALMNDFRVFAGSFVQYAQTNGACPASYTTAGGFTATMAGLINETKWQRRTPIGGNDAFLKDNTVGGVRYRALIRVSGSGAAAITFPSAQLLRLDQKSDNGNLASGQLFTNGAALNTGRCQRVADRVPGRNGAFVVRGLISRVARNRETYFPPYQTPRRQLWRWSLWTSAGGISGRSLTAQLASAWATLRIPGITVVTAGWARTHFSAACGMV